MPNLQPTPDFGSNLVPVLSLRLRPFRAVAALAAALASLPASAQVDAPPSGVAHSMAHCVPQAVLQMHVSNALSSATAGVPAVVPQLAEQAEVVHADRHELSVVQAGSSEQAVAWAMHAPVSLFCAQVLHSAAGDPAAKPMGEPAR